MKLLEKRKTNQGLYRVRKKEYFKRVYYEIQKRAWCGIWFTLDDGGLECPWTYKFNRAGIEEFFKTGAIQGTRIPN